MSKHRNAQRIIKLLLLLQRIRQPLRARLGRSSRWSEALHRCLGWACLHLPLHQPLLHRQVPWEEKQIHLLRKLPALGSGRVPPFVAVAELVAEDADLYPQLVQPFIRANWQQIAD